VGVSATAVTPCARLDSYGLGRIDPFFGCEVKAVQACLLFKGLEIATFKCRVVYLFPNTTTVRSKVEQNQLVRDGWGLVL